MEPDLPSFLWGLLVPGLVTGVGLLAVWGPRRREAGLPKERAQAALLSGAAFFAGYWGLFGLPPLPFSSRVLGALDWIPWLAAGGGLLLAATARAGVLAHVARAGFAAATLWIVLRAMRAHHWTGAETVRWMGGLALLLAAVWFCAARLSRARGAALTDVSIEVRRGSA